MSTVTPPTGTVTFLFTDIEGSTRMWERDAASMEPALAGHDDVVRSGIERNGGYVFKTIGDAFCAAFARADDALGAGIEVQQALVADSTDHDPIRVRMAIHTGQPEHRDGDYFGRDVNRVARLLSIGHGGQILVSGTAHDLLDRDAIGDATLRDLGSHELRDVERPERVFQVVHPDLQSEFPALRTTGANRHNLPQRLTKFIGRESEIDTVERLVSEHRLVTLTGVGGTGKTRLATEVALQIVDRFEDGVWLIELGAVSDSGRIAQVVASGLGIREAVGRPLIEQIAENLRESATLLVLDNCEHVLEAAAEVATAALRAGPGVRVLATSREPLGVEGEQVWRVPVMGEDEAVRLFADRARLARSDFAVDESNAAAVARVSRRLDGIPLAIELAAARASLLSPNEIDARLDDRFKLLKGSRAGGEAAHHETLEATIAWSYDLLDDAEKDLFRRLSVFAGGWSLEAAEAVCPAEIDAVETLQALVGKSLVIVDRGDGESRYRLLETTREYASAKLAETEDEAAVRQAHLDWFADFAESIEAGLTGPDSRSWMRRLDAESENLRDALAWSLDRGGAQALRMVSRLWRYWLRSGALTEGIDWAARVVETAGSADTRVRGRALYGLASLLFFHGELERSRVVADEALALGREGEDRRITTMALAALGRIDLTEGALDTAIDRHEEALALARERPEGQDSTTVSLLLANLAEIYRARGELERARGLYEEALEISIAEGLVTIEDMHRFNLGQTALGLGDLDGAASQYRGALAIGNELGNRLTSMYGLIGLAQVATARGDAQRAAVLFGAGDALKTSMGTMIEGVDRELLEQSIDTVRETLGENGFDAAWAEGHALGLEAATTLALEEKS